MQQIVDVFVSFFKLGLIAFGGPIAHIGYFQKKFVIEKQWLTEHQFAQLLMLCQFLPGPASSQMGFSIGLKHAGWWGAIAAFVAFTLPSALLLFAFALYLPLIPTELSSLLVDALKLVALAVVAHAVITMAKKLCPDLSRAAIALLTLVVLLMTSSAWLQLVIIAVAALLGVVLCRKVNAQQMDLAISSSRRVGFVLLVLFLMLLVLLPLLAASGPSLFTLLDAFYRPGALVFGGGHVVLPLLEQTVVEPGWLSSDQFLAGYGAAQAVPGPVFSVASFLGANFPAPFNGAAGALLATLAIFLPGFLLLSAMLPLWQQLVQHPQAARAIAGANAAVVGLLAAALYNPIWTSAVNQLSDVLIAAVGTAMMFSRHLSALWVTVWCVGSVGLRSVLL
jgi:chromate transporter